MSTAEDQLIYYSEKAGDVVRKLALGAIAIIWLMHVSNVSTKESPFVVPIDNALRWPIILIVLGLLADAFQYVVGALLWAINANNCASKEAMEHKRTLKTNFFLAVIKLILMACAYVWLACAIYSKGFWR